MKKLLATILSVGLMSSAVFVEGVPGENSVRPAAPAKRIEYKHMFGSSSKALPGVYIFFYLNCNKDSHVEIKLGKIGKDKFRYYKIIGNDKQEFQDDSYEALKKVYVDFFSSMPIGFSTNLFRKGRIDWYDVIKKENFKLLDSEVLFWVIGDQVQKFINELDYKLGTVLELNSGEFLDELLRRVVGSLTEIGCSEQAIGEFLSVVVDNKGQKYTIPDLTQITVVKDDSSVVKDDSSSTEIDIPYLQYLDKVCNCYKKS